jgi:hypothetical protein
MFAALLMEDIPFHYTNSIIFIHQKNLKQLDTYLQKLWVE